ncbi:polyhomeotic-like protein 3 isoform X7 [Ascaphus truei]|uniref:polyhomeotic-like protein 3 isoform X7 n=1 Tax=Ascaphus truei TaxID=8439 RepID=UPI003F5A34EF
MRSQDSQHHCGTMENEQIITTSSASATTSTPSPSHPPPISVYSSSDRHAVQVIQQALNRPPSSAAQYLQQMYAAQQQHLMLQTAALQQQHLSSAQLQSLASVQQASVTGDRRSASPASIIQQSNVPQPSINLSASPPPPQIISRSQTSSTTTSSITQKTMLLGSTSPTLSASQAQMYLRAQMLIFTPAATVAAVQSDIPVISSSSSTSCQSSATQVQNVTLRGQKPMPEMTGPHSSPPKLSSHDQPLTICHKTTVTSSKAIHTDSSYENNRKGQSPSSESRCTAVTRTSSLHQLIAPVSYSPIHPHSLIKHPTIPLHPDPPKLSHHQMILQQQQQFQHRHQIQTITLHNPTLEPPSPQHCVPLHSHSFLPLHGNAHSHHCTPPPSPTLSQSAQQSVVVSPPPTHSPGQSPTIIIHPQALIQPQPPLLVQSTLPSREKAQHLLQGTMHPAQQLSVPIQFPPALSPGPHAGSLQQQTMVSCGQQAMSPIMQAHQSSLQPFPPPTASPPQQFPTTPPAQLQALPLQSMHAVAVQPEILTPGQVLVQNALMSEEELPAAEALVQLPFQGLPPPQTVAVNLHIQSAQMETPVVNRSSLLVEQPVKGQPAVGEQIMSAPGMESEIQNTAKLPENSTDTDMEDLTAEEGADDVLPELLECEFCGKAGYSSKFLRSKRFCSMSCAKSILSRYNANGTKRLGLFKADKSSRWSRKIEGNLSRRGRRPMGSEGSIRDHYLRQLPTAYSRTDEAGSPEDCIPAAMTTRLRRQSERGREHELRLLQIRKTPAHADLLPDAHTETSLWTVEEVWAFIHSLPGCHDIADEFRTQEIDGQALLLLKEDHLMSTMNIKLGPALKICARINSLKEA